MCDVVTYKVQDAVALIAVNNPPVNTLSLRVRRDLLDALSLVSESKHVHSAVIYCKGKTFFAGADIAEFDKPMRSPALPELLTAIEAMDKPIVAAMHGTVLGGGLELALACHYRIALETAQFGLPEVNLGLLPGSGGTQRLPRLIGAEASLKMLTSGKTVSARQASVQGLVDRVVDDELVEQACDYARHLIAISAPVRKLSAYSVNTAVLGPDFFDDCRAEMHQRHPGFNAPQACIDAVEAATMQPFELGVQTELSLFRECLKSEQSKAMRRLFYAERQAAHLSASMTKQRLRPINEVAVLGAGKMGTAIAIGVAKSGRPVVLVDTNQAALDISLERIKAYFKRQIRIQAMSTRLAQAACERITPSLQLESVRNADLVIEAIHEDLDSKRKLFAKLDGVCKRSAILATDTSTIAVDAIASATSRAQDVIGLHFSTPAHTMRLLEIVHTTTTQSDVIATVTAFAKAMGKVAVVVKQANGFVGNRLLRGYQREAERLLLDGATPAEVDSAMRNFGMALGPFAMADMAGLEVSARVRQQRRKNGSALAPYEGAIADQLVAQARLGQINQKGLYCYDADSHVPQHDDEVLHLIEQTSAELGISRRHISSEDIVNRLLDAMINDATALLEQDCVHCAADIDVIWVYGLGFPAYKGGPLYYAEQRGLANVVAAMQARSATQGDRWEPTPLLQKLVRKEEGFTSLAH